KDLFASVDTDTLMLAQPAKEIEVVVEPELSPEGTQPVLKGFHVSLFDSKAAPPSERKANTKPWGKKTLEPPRRAQMSYVGGNVLCSPTSVSMDLSYWSQKLNEPSLDLDVPLVQQGVYDVVYNGTGNWAFNMAYAAGQPGMKAYVSRFRDVRDLEDWLEKGVPVACSVAYGLLKGKAQRDPDDGHLVLLVGFTKSGDLIFNDPGRNIVRMTYKRADFERAWATSHRTVYMIHPEGWEVPEGDGPWDHSS
ncbi:MAG: C39 family peptidase, partial [Armatimonadota bacterium]